MQIKIKTLIIGVILLIITGIGLGIYGTKKYWPTTITITDSSVGQTMHTVPTNIDINNPEDCQKAKEYMESDIKVEGHMKDNILIGRAYDASKYVDFSFTFKAKPSYKYIFQFGMGYMIQHGYFVHPGMLYQTGFWNIAIGGSCILPISDYKNFAAEIMVQKAFF